MPVSGSLKYFLPALCIIFLSYDAEAQQADFRQLFGDDWNKALSFLNENDPWIRNALERYDIPYEEAIAVVFPELVRYSAIRDKLETGVLKALYVNLGKDYANFSIGQFQIKPSFAEKIRENAKLLPGRTGRDLFGRKQPEERELRSLIVSELEAPEKEFSYVIAFYLLCVRNFKDLPGPAESRIRFLAAAYNTGFWKNREEIEKTAEMKFYSTKLVTKEYYSYCDVAIFWYRNHYQAHPAN